MDGLTGGDIDMSSLMMAPPGYFTLPSSVASPYDDDDAVSSTSGSGSCPDSPVLSVGEAAAGPGADDEKMVSAPVPAVGSLLPVAPPAGHFFALAQHGAPQLPPPVHAHPMMVHQQEAPQLPPAALAQTGPGRVIRGKLTRAASASVAASAPAPAPARSSRKRARGSSPEDDDEYEEEDEDEGSAAARKAAGGRRAKGGAASAAPKQPRATKKSKNAAGAAVPVVDGKLLTDLVETYKEKQDKLKHKAKLARDSRRKKKERLEQLEGEVARLTALLAEEKALREQEQAAAAKASVCICSALSAEIKAAATKPAAASAPAAAAAAPAPAPLADSVQRAAQNITSKYTEHLHTMMKQFPHAPPFACTSRNLEADLAKSAALSGLAGKDAVEHAKAVTATHLNFDAAMETLADGFTGALKTRGEVVEMQLAALEKALEPPMALYFLEWLMTQPDMFYLDPAGIWSKLVHGTLAVSQQQLQALFTLRATVRAQRNAETDLRIGALGLNASLMAFAAMRSASAAGNAAADTSAADVSLFSALPQQIAAHMSMHRSFQVFTRLARLHLTGLEGYIKGLRAILSPAQLALFFAFVEENAAICTLVH